MVVVFASPREQGEAFLYLWAGLLLTDGEDYLILNGTETTGQKQGSAHCVIILDA